MTRSELYRCLQRYDIRRLAAAKGVDIAEMSPEEGKLYLFVAIDRTSKFAYAQLHEQAHQMMAVNFLRNLITHVPDNLQDRSFCVCAPLWTGLPSVGY